MNFDTLNVIKATVGTHTVLGKPLSYTVGVESMSAEQLGCGLVVKTNHTSLIDCFCSTFSGLGRPYYMLGKGINLMLMAPFDLLNI